MIGHQDCIIDVFTDSGLGNLRSVKSLIIDFERVYYVWGKSNIPLEKIDNVLYAFGAVLFERKANNFAENPRYGYAFAITELKKKYTAFDNFYHIPALQNWITEGLWDERAFVCELAQRLNKEELPDDKKFLLFRFWDLDSKIIESGLPVALQHAYAGELTGDELIHLLQHVFLLQHYRVDLPCDIDFQKIGEGFQKRKEQMKSGVLTEARVSTFIQEDIVSQMEPDAKILYREIESLDDKKIAWENRRKVIAFLNGDVNISRHNLKNNFLVSFDDELALIFFEQFASQENERKSEYLSMLKDLDFRYNKVSSLKDIKVTITNFEQLKEQMGYFRDNCKDSIAKIIAAEYVKVLLEMIPELQKEINRRDA